MKIEKISNRPLLRQAAKAITGKHLLKEMYFLRLEEMVAVSEFLRALEVVPQVQTSYKMVPVWYVLVMSLRRHGREGVDIRNWFRWFLRRTPEEQAIIYAGVLTDMWSPVQETVIQLQNGEWLDRVELVLPEDLEDAAVSEEKETGSLVSERIYEVKSRVLGKEIYVKIREPAALRAEVIAVDVP